MSVGNRRKLNEDLTAVLVVFFELTWESLLAGEKKCRTSAKAWLAPPVIVDAMDMTESDIWFPPFRFTMLMRLAAVGDTNFFRLVGVIGDIVGKCEREGGC